MKRFLKWLFAILGAILLLAVGLAVTVLTRPQLVLNDRTLIVAAHLADRAGIHAGWESGHVSIESLGLLQKRVHLDFGGLCVRAPAQGLDACFDRARITAAGGLKGFKPVVTEIGPIDIAGRKLTYTIAQEEKKAEKKPVKEEDKSNGPFPELIARAKVLPIRVELLDWAVVSGKTRVQGALDLDSQAAESGAAVIRLDSRADVAPGGQHAEARARLANPKGYFETDGWKIALDALAKLPDGTRADVRARLDPRSGAGPLAYAYSLLADYRKGGARAHAEIQGQAQPDRIAARISADARGLSESVKHAWIDGCELKLERTGAKDLPGSFKASCPVRATVPVPPKGFPKLAMPTRAGARITADLRTGAFPPSADSVLEGKAGVELDPILSPVLEGGGKVESQLAGVPSRYPKDWKMDTDLGLRLKIPSFERLVKQLSNTPFDVWAPLRPLKGMVELDVKGRFDANSGTVPVRLVSRLGGKPQKLDVDATGQLKIARFMPRPSMNLSLDVALSQIELELPPLPELPSPAHPKPDPVPQLFPDDRIQSYSSSAAWDTEATQQAGTQGADADDSAKDAEPMFTYDVKIHTRDDDHPLKLLTPQIQAPIPVAVDIKLASGAPPSGQVQALTFPLKLFKRDVRLDHLTVDLKQPSKDSELDGRIVIPYTDYTITILLLGTTDKPQMRFLSDPPLPDDQIIAVLIFGQKLDALDPDQQQSVGSSRAALRQGVFGLASLYYLSSMNIESVDYDPSTGIASMRYRLAEGTSLNVSEGTGGGQPSVGVRKRLSKHLAITTTLNNPSETQANRTVSTFLEWAYQY